MYNFQVLLHAKVCPWVGATWLLFQPEQCVHFSKVIFDILIFYLCS